MLYNVNQKIFENINTGSDQTDYLIKQVAVGLDWHPLLSTVSHLDGNETVTDYKIIQPEPE